VAGTAIMRLGALPLATALLLAGCGQPQPAAAPAQAPQQVAAAPAGPALPALTGRVVDQANLLSPAEEAGLTADLAALEARTTDQLVIVTVPSLGGQAIADYGMALGNRWQIGQRGKDNGLLIIVAPTERQARIELGLGLARIIPNARAQAIMDEAMLPHFRRSEWHGGIRAGMEALIGDLVANEHVPRRGRQ
jgi:uncharacterized protein